MLADGEAITRPGVPGAGRHGPACGALDGILGVLLVVSVFGAFRPLLNSTVTADVTSDQRFVGALPVVETFPAWSAAARFLDAAIAEWPARGQHVLGIAVHAVNAVLVYLLARTLFARSRGNAGRDSWSEHAAALVAGLLFALHPQRVEALGWTDQLPLVVSAGLCLTAVLLYLGTATRRWAVLPYIGAVVLSPLGLVLPVLLMLLDYWPLRRWSAAPGRVLLEKMLLLLIAAGALWWWGAGAHPGADGGYTWAQRMLIAAHDAVQFARDFIVPLRLAPGREAPWPISPWGWPYLAGCVGAPVLLVFAVWYQRRVPGLLPGAVAYLLALAPAAFLLLREVEAGADRYSYMPAVVLALGCGAVLSAVFRRPGVEARGYGWGGTAVLLVASGVLGWLTHRQCEHWSDPSRLWEHAVAVRPDSALAGLRLARWAESQADVERAGQLYYLAMERRVNWPAPARGLAATQLVSGQPERAAESFARALRLRPNSATLNYEYAVALAAAGQPARAAEHFRRARELAPAQPAVWIGLSRVLRQMGEWGEAERVLSEARRRWPNEALVERELALYPGGGSAPTVVPGAPAGPASAPRSRSTYQE